MSPESEVLRGALPRAATGEERGELGALSAMVLLGIATVLVTAIKPLMLTAYKEELGFPDDTAGYLLALEFTGEVAMLFLVSLGIHRWNRRTLAIASVLTIVAANLLSIAADGFAALALYRFVAGLGTGTGVAVMSASLAGTAKPTRSFSIYTVCLLAVSVAAFLMLPRLIDRHGLGSVFLLLAAATLPAWASLRWLPAFAPATGAYGSGFEKSSLRAPAALLTLAAAMLYFVAVGGFWPFIGEIGKAIGIEKASIGYVLAGMQVAGFLGSLTAALVDTRWGRSLPIAAAILGGLSALAALLIWSGQAAVYFVAVLLFQFSYLFVFPYFNGVGSFLDPSGRLPAVSMTIQSLGLAAGPAIAGWLSVTSGGYGAVTAATMLLIAASGLLILRVTSRMMKRA